jgi:DNA-binding LacI/PurR family transcriptional regulator
VRRNPSGNKKTAIAHRRVTADDVARLAGVSRSTVSRAYTPGASVSAEKRERILALGEHLGYQPNLLAAGLNRSSPSNLVAIVTGNLSNFYDNALTSRLVERLNALGKWALVVGGDSEEISSRVVLDVLSFPLDAMVVRAGSLEKKVASQCLKFKVPLVSSGMSLAMENVDSLCCDNGAGARLAVEALIAAGRCRIGYIGGPREMIPEQERYDGFITALMKAGLGPAALERSDFSFAGGYRAAMKLLSGDERPDALFCCNDAMAIGAINAARETLKLEIPREIAIIGFDDIEMAAWPCFNLTTVRNSIAQTVDGIMDLLRRRFANPERGAETILLAPTLIRRGTL